MMRLAIFCLTALACTLAGPVCAQRPDTISTAGAVKILRESGNPMAATALLSQTRRSVSAGELDALADSLVSIASTYREDDPLLAQSAAIAASTALLVAARASEGTRGGTPYARAFERLAAIYEQSKSPGIKGSVLGLMAEMPNREKAVSYLAEVAKSQTSYAPTAVRHLAHDTGPTGLARLRQLYVTNAILEPTAREHTLAVASVHGWSP